MKNTPTKSLSEIAEMLRFEAGMTSDVASRSVMEKAAEKIGSAPEGMEAAATQCLCSIRARERAFVRVVRPLMDMMARVKPRKQKMLWAVTAHMDGGRCSLATCRRR